MNSTILKYLPMQSIDSATLTGGYQIFTGASPFTEACFKVTVTNASDKPVTISFDGVTDAFAVGAGLFYDLSLQLISDVLVAKGTLPKIKGTAGTGNIYLSAFYV